MTRRWIQLLWASFLAVVFVGWAAPAFAQNGTMTGRVIDVERRMTDTNGKPIGGGKQKDAMGLSKDPEDLLLGVSEATVTLQLKGESPRKFQVMTDAFGDWYKSGLPPGTYDVSVRKEWRDPVLGRTTNPGNLVVFIAEATNIVLQPKEKVRVPNLSAMTEEALAAGRRAPVASNLSNAEAEAANKRAAELNAIADAVVAALEAGKYDEAIVMLTDIANKKAEKGEKCGACYVKIGEAEIKLKHEDKAEAAFLKAIELEPNLQDPYSQLASLYNGQRKFDEAAKMSAKAKS